MYVEEKNMNFKRHIINKLQSNSVTTRLISSPENKERVDYLLETIKYDKAAIRYKVDEKFGKKLKVIAKKITTIKLCKLF